MTDCARCGQPFKEGDLYVEAHQYADQEYVTSIPALFGNIRIHVDCPRTYIPPAFDPTTLLQCGNCPHVAAQHGFRFDFDDGHITFGDMSCEACVCPKFEQHLPELPPHLRKAKAVRSRRR
jgi:hypothetical protein